ncbi:hypothetical protein F2Q69_00052417, partial [Brassica cretica]
MKLESLSDVASSDVVLAHSTFDALRLGRSAQIIVGRLLRFGDSKNIKKQGEFMGITLLFLDEKVLIPSYMDSFLPVALLITVRPCEWVQLSESPALKLQDHFNWLDDNAAISNKQLCSVGDLNMFLSSSTTQEGFIYKARIVEINQAIADNMYRVEILVDDGNNYAIVVVLNKEMLKLTKQDAATLFLNEVISKPQTLIKTVAITQISKKLQVNSGGDRKLPQCIEELEGQTFIFHIHVSPSNSVLPSNSASSHCPFTVSAISGKITTEDFNNNETPYAVREFSEASTSASPINTSTVEVEQGGRKDA